MVTPGSTAPDASRTTPRTVAVEIWAAAWTPVRRIAADAAANTNARTLLWP